MYLNTKIVLYILRLLNIFLLSLLGRSHTLNYYIYNIVLFIVYT